MVYYWEVLQAAANQLFWESILPHDCLLYFVLMVYDSSISESKPKSNLTLGRKANCSKQATDIVEREISKYF